MADAFVWWFDPLLRPALIAGVLTSVLCGILGTFVVLRRLAFLAGGLSHAAFGGLGLCHLLQLPPQAGGLATTAIAALLLGPMSRRTALARDALIGVFWAAGMAAGVLFLHFSPGYPPDLGAYLFGNILLVGAGDLWLLAGLDALVLLLLLLFYKEVVAATFDETFAAVQGVPVRLLSTLLLLLVGAAVVVLLPVVGLLLVLALLTIPALVGLALCRSLERVLLTAVGVGLAITLGGLWLSYAWDAPSGPCIIVVGTLLLLVVRGGEAIARRPRAGTGVV